MRRELLLAEFLSTPWALSPARLDALAQLLTRWQVGAAAQPEVLASVHADMQAMEARRATVSSAATGATANGVAVIPCYGVLTQRGNMASEVSGSGATSTQQLTSAIRAARADNSVAAALIDFNTPGGSVYGIPEAAAEIRALREVKPVVGIVNSVCCSAGYWLAAQCSELYCTPSGEAGNIGVYTTHKNTAKAMEAQGVEVTLISAGKFKAEGNPFGPLGDEALAAVQANVDAMYASFIRDVAQGRRVNIEAVRNGYGEGRSLLAADALKAGVIDGIDTFDNVLARLQKGRANVSASRARAARELQILG